MLNIIQKNSLRDPLRNKKTKEHTNSLTFSNLLLNERPPNTISSAIKITFSPANCFRVACFYFNWHNDCPKLKYLNRQLKTRAMHRLLFWLVLIGP